MLVNGRSVLLDINVINILLLVLLLFGTHVILEQKLLLNLLKRNNEILNLGIPSEKKVRLRQDFII